jgi:hypothetical protein
MERMAFNFATVKIEFMLIAFGLNFESERTEV